MLKRRAKLLFFPELETAFIFIEVLFKIQVNYLNDILLGQV